MSANWLRYCNETILTFQMEEEEHTDRKQQLAMLYQKLNKIKKSLNEGNMSTRYLEHEFTMYIIS